MAKIGFLYSIGLLIMSLTVLSLALFIAQVEKESNEQVADLARFDRLFDIDSSINDAFSEVFRVSSGIDAFYNGTENTLYFIENLPNENNTIFSQNMTSFKDFLEVYFSNSIENVSIDENNFNKVTNNLEFIILPNNITYTHIPSFGDNTIRVSPPFSPLSLEYILNHKAYNITIYSSSEVSDPASIWNPVPGTMPITIYVLGPTTSLKKNDKIGSQLNELSYLLVKDPSNANLVNISFNNSRLFIDNLNPSKKLIVKIGIVFNDIQDERLTLEYPKKIYNITLNELDVKRLSRVILLTFPE